MRNVGFICDFSELGAIDGSGNMGVFNTETVKNTQPVGGAGSNLDLVSEPDPIPKMGDGKFIPQKGESIDKRVDALENAMVQVVDGLTTIRREMKDGFAKISGNQ